MKLKLSLLLLTLAVSLQAADKQVTLAPDKPAPAKSTSWWTDISVSPYASVVHNDLKGGPIYGAGLDLGYAINHTVSLHVANLSQEVNDQWDGDPLIKKTSALVRADLIRYSRERLVTYVLARGDRDWATEDWGFGVGVGEELRFTKNISAFADYSLVAQFKNEKFGQLRVGLSARF